MGIYGHTFDNLINQQKENNILNEVTITIKDGNNEAKVYIRSGTQATSGGSISNNSSEQKMNHAASVKIGKAKGENLVPVQIHSNKAEYNQSKMKELGLPSDLLDASIDFINNNIENLNKYWNTPAANEEELADILKKIIDNSIDNISNISSPPNKKVMDKYYKDKLKEKKKEKTKKKQEKETKKKIKEENKEDEKI